MTVAIVNPNIKFGITITVLLFEVAYDAEVGEIIENVFRSTPMNFVLLTFYVIAVNFFFFFAFHRPGQFLLNTRAPQSYG